MKRVVLPVRWRVVLINGMWFAALVLFHIALHHFNSESKTASAAATFTGAVLTAIFGALAWQLCMNRAVIDCDEIFVQAGFYTQRWPLQVIHQTWSEHHLSEFHRSNGVHIYGYSAGYYTRAGAGRHFLLAIGESRVRCFEMEGYSPLCLDGETHSRLLSYAARSIE